MSARWKMKSRVLLGTIVLAMSKTMAATELDGTWVLNISMQSGTGRSTFTFSQQGESITGNYTGQLGEAAVSGTLKDGIVAFSYQVEVQGVPVEVAYRGSIDDGVMHGTVTIIGFGDGTFRGTKTH